jgi:phosphoribosylglycinamide formyltransferase-1
MKSIIVFASGAGSNFSSIIQYAKTNNAFSIALLVVNKEDAPVIHLAKEQGIPILILNKEVFNNTEWIATLAAYHPSLIVLVGFLWKLPEKLVTTFERKIINIHPALLPKYGGKGMYGMHVHRAVVENKDSETGITIHYVNENYDEGNIIFQKSIFLTGTESPEDVADKIHELEQTYFPMIIEKILNQKS